MIGVKESSGNLADVNLHIDVSDIMPIQKQHEKMRREVASEAPSGEPLYSVNALFFDDIYTINQT